MVLNWKSVDQLKFKICKQIHSLFIITCIFLKEISFEDQDHFDSMNCVNMKKKLFITMFHVSIPSSGFPKNSVY